VNTQDFSSDKISTRRRLIQSSGALAMAGGVSATGALSLLSTAHAAGSDEIRVGLIGCGGRGRR
jgi:hypothetical protein